MKILAVIISYFPDKTLLEKNIASFAEYVDKILIWENIPKEKAADYRPEDKYGKLVFWGTGENAGISKALNKVWRYAKESGYEYILTMDQDSVWHGFKDFISKIENSSYKDKALFGPCVNDRRILQDFEPTWALINSGMLVPVPVLNALGGYDERFFVDAVDVELICNAKSHGYEAFFVGGCYLEQNFGKMQISHALGRNFKIYNYSPARLYNIYRNHIIVFKRYPDALPLKRMFIKVWIRRRIVRILLGEKQKLHKLSAIIRGIFSGLFYAE